MKTTTTLAVLAAAATLTAVSVEPLAQAQTTTARAGTAETPSMSMSEFRRWQRNWDRRLRDMWESDASRYAWGKEKRAIKSQVVVLDPAIGKIGPADKVTVEWFFAPIDERSMILAPGNASVVMRKWEKTIKNAGEERIHIIPRIVSEGPGVPNRFAEQMRLVQDMIYAWGDNPWKGNALTARAALVNAKQPVERITEADVRRILDESELDGSAWPKKRMSPETAQRAMLANSRYQEAIRQAAEHGRRKLETPYDPILLIDGKYLLTGYATKTTERLFRMANWIIRERLDRLSQRSFDIERIEWGNEHHPTRKELITLPGEEHDRPWIEVEWFFTYVSDDGVTTDIAWFEKLFEHWKTSVQIGGVRNIRISRHPVVRLTREETPYWDRQRRVHQQLVLGWSDERPGWKRQVHGMLPRFLAKNPRSIDTLAAGDAVLERLELPVEQYREDLAAPGRQEEMEALNKRVLQVRNALPRKLRNKAVEPVLVVNGKYLIEGQTAGSVERVFQILNWTVRQLVEQSG